MSDLAALLVDVRQRLAASGDSTTWPDALLTDALRQALDDFARQGTIYESSFTVTTAGHEQDLSAVAQLHSLLAVAWPWDDDVPFWRRTVDFRIVNGATVRIERGEPAVDDLLRLRYRKLHEIENLDSAAATTLSAHEERIILWLAAGRACLLRALDLAEDPSAADGAVAALEKQGAGYLDTAWSLLIDNSSGGPVVWREIGL